MTCKFHAVGMNGIDECHSFGGVLVYLTNCAGNRGGKNCWMKETARVLACRKRRTASELGAAAEQVWPDLKEVGKEKEGEMKRDRKEERSNPATSPDLRK